MSFQRLHAKAGHEQDPIPCHQTVRLQFSPNHPTRLTSARFSRRFKIVRKVQTRCLRKQHEDAHWVAALAKYNKIHLCSVRDATVEAGLVGSVVAAGLDDKAMIPEGLPGLPVDSRARPHGPVFALAEEQLAASDHDADRQGAIVPSLHFLKQIPEHPSDSWYSGSPICVLHDAVFEKSNPFFHAANLLHILRSQGGADGLLFGLRDLLFLSLQHDGGADHHNQHLKVKLSLLALKRCLPVKRLDSQRGCPGQSAALIHERVFSLLNIGLQHTAFARPELDDPECEAMLANLSSMAQIRHAAGVGPPPKNRSAKTATSKEQHLLHKDPEKNEEGSSEDEDSDEREVDCILKERVVRGEKQFLVRWAKPYEDDEPSWEPATNLDGAPQKVEAWRRSRLRPEEQLAEKAAEAAKAEARAKEDADAEAEAEAKAERRRRLIAAWKRAQAKVIAKIKERLVLLELKGKRVECPPPAPPEIEAELHASLLELDCAYDPAYSLNSQLSKMPIIAEYFADEKHTFDSTYMLSLQDCVEEDCKFGCCGWKGVPKEVKSLLHCKPVLPICDPTRPGHMYEYQKASALPAGTDERDLPSQMRARSQDDDGVDLRERMARDKQKKLHPSKVRATIECYNCGRPRCIFATEQPRAKEFKQLDAYCETSFFVCGTSIFHPDDDNEVHQSLASTFYNREALGCRSLMELDYFNYGGLRGRAEFEHVCSRCGQVSEESPFIDSSKLSASETKGKLALPLCTDCYNDARERLGSAWHQELRLVKRSDKVTANIERKLVKKAAKEKAEEAKVDAATKKKAEKGGKATRTAARAAKAKSDKRKEPTSAPPPQKKAQRDMTQFFASESGGGNGRGNYGAGSSSGGVRGSSGGNGEGGDDDVEMDDEFGPDGGGGGGEGGSAVVGGGGGGTGDGGGGGGGGDGGGGDGGGGDGSG